VYGTADTLYWTPFARLAMVPEFCSSVTFPSLMGTPLANEVLYLERKLTEKEALSANLISSIIPPERITEHVKSLAVKLASLPFALKTALQFKSLLKRPKINMLKEVLDNEYSVLIARYVAGDVASAVFESMKSKL
jgi:peroxisomal 3,2-trans-enoyl-CoA isomerase